MNIEITELTRRFGRTWAVAGVSLQAGPGVSGCSGPNGAGKTSLLRMMATVLAPSSGRMGLLGRDPGELRAAAGDPAPARLPAAEPRLLPGLHRRRVRRVLRAAQGHAAGAGAAAVATAIERVGLGDKARAKLRTLSGGMLRRVGIAQAIVNDPELLLLDEPTAGLDPEQRVAFRALLRELGERATVMVSTHLVEDVGAACTEVSLMDAGQVVFHGTPERS